MPPARFEPTISAGERPQTHALDRVATGTGTVIKYIIVFIVFIIIIIVIIICNLLLLSTPHKAGKRFFYFVSVTSERLD